MSINELPELLTLREATEVLRVHANTLRNWERDGLVAAVRIGPRRDRRYQKSVIIELLASQNNYAA